MTTSKGIDPIVEPRPYDATLALIAGQIAAQLCGDAAGWMREPGRQNTIIETAMAMASAIVVAAQTYAVKPMAPPPQTTA